MKFTLQFHEFSVIRTIKPYWLFRLLNNTISTAEVMWDQMHSNDGCV